MSETGADTALPGLGVMRAKKSTVYRTYCAASRKLNWPVSKRDRGRCSSDVDSSAASRNSLSRSAEDCLASHERRATGASVASPRSRILRSSASNVNEHRYWKNAAPPQAM